jgi:hypothetical protein
VTHSPASEPLCSCSLCLLDCYSRFKVTSEIISSRAPLLTASSQEVPNILCPPPAKDGSQTVQCPLASTVTKRIGWLGKDGSHTKHTVSAQYLRAEWKIYLTPGVRVGGSVALPRPVISQLMEKLGAGVTHSGRGLCLPLPCWQLPWAWSPAQLLSLSFLVSANLATACQGLCLPFLFPQDTAVCVVKALSQTGRQRPAPREPCPQNLPTEPQPLGSLASSAPVETVHRQRLSFPRQNINK